MSDIKINLIEVKEVPVSLVPDKPAAMKQVRLMKNWPFHIPRIAPGSFVTYNSELYRVLRVDFDFDNHLQLIFISRNFTSQIAAGPGPDDKLIFYNMSLHAQKWSQQYFNN